MKHKHPHRYFALAAVVLMAGPQAHADLQANLHMYPVAQVGVGGFVSFGTIVDASTNINSIWASANFRIECSDPKIRPAPHGSRGWSDNGIKGPRSIAVSVPEWVPAIQELPGWLGVMGGALVSCVYTTSGFAKTNILPIGGGGVTIPLGGDSWEETRTQAFTVIKPGTSFGGGCIM